MIASHNSNRLRIPRVHRVRRHLSDGRVRVHLYHRPTGRRLPPLDSPDFQSAYKAAEQQWASQQRAANPSELLSASENTLATPPQPAVSAAVPKRVTRIFASKAVHQAPRGAFAPALNAHRTPSPP